MTASFGSILVPLEGSAVAEQAVPVGASLARRAGVPLHLVSVHEPSPVAVIAGAGAFGAKLERESHEELSRYLASMLTTPETRGATVLREVVDGDAADALADYIARRRIGLVVMTTHARKGFTERWLGGVADRLLRRTRAPCSSSGRRSAPSQISSPDPGRARWSA